MKTVGEVDLVQQQLNNYETLKVSFESLMPDKLQNLDFNFPAEVFTEGKSLFVVPEGLGGRTFYCKDTKKLKGSIEKRGDKEKGKPAVFSQAAPGAP